MGFARARLSRASRARSATMTRAAWNRGTAWSMRVEDDSVFVTEPYDQDINAR